MAIHVKDQTQLGHSPLRLLCRYYTITYTMGEWGYKLGLIYFVYCRGRLEYTFLPWFIELRVFGDVQAFKIATAPPLVRLTE